MRADVGDVSNWTTEEIDLIKQGKLSRFVTLHTVC